MALTRVNAAGKEFAFGIPTGTGAETEADGVTSVTSAELSSSLETNVTAKDETGEVVAHLFGNKKLAMSVEGYSDAAALPATGAVLKVAGQEGRIMSASITASNEDFVRVRAEGEGYAGLDYTA